MIEREIKTSENDRPMPAMPGHDVATSWGKCDVDDYRLMPAPPPLWTHHMDSRHKEYCNE
jgi:hypothetical protein